MTDEDYITLTIEREGGAAYTNRGDDRGGPTKYGITQGMLARARGHEVAAADVEALTEAEARTIYREKVLIEPGAGGGGVVPYLPLNELTKPRTPGGSQGPGAGQGSGVGQGVPQ